MYKFIVRKIDYLIPLLVALFTILVAYSNVGTGIINYSDHKYPFNFYKLFINQLYVWNDNIFLGFNQSLSLSLNLSYTALFAFIQWLVPDYIIVNRLEYIIAIFCNFYFTYLFLTSIFSEKLGNIKKMALLLCASFFFSNALSVGLFYGGLSQQIFAFSFIPLALYGFRKYFVTDNRYWLILIVVACLFIASVNFPYGFIAVGAVVLVLLSFSDWSWKLKVKYASFFIVAFVLLNAYWLVPFGYSAFFAPPQAFFESISAKSRDSLFTDYLKDTASRYSLEYLFSLAPSFDLIRNQNGDDSPLVNYYASNYILILSYLGTILVLGYSFFAKKTSNQIKTRRIALAVIFLVALFLAKGQNNPLVDLYPFLVKKTVFLKMFRDSMKWMIIPYLIFIILSANLFVNSRSKVVKALLALFFASYLFPWAYGGLMGKLRAYDVPDYYFQLEDVYQKTDGLSDKRAIILDSEARPTSYNFDTRNLMSFSSNILKSISPMPTVDMFSNGGGIAFSYLKIFYEGLNKNDDDLREFQKIGATHLYHQWDIKDSGSYDYSDKYFEKDSFGLIDVYALKKEYVNPKIYLAEANDQAESKFFKISPVEYRIRINGIKDVAYLNFLYTFDQNWDLYLNKIGHFPECSATEDAKFVDDEKTASSRECLVIGDAPWDGDENHFLGDVIFSDKHSILSGIFNKWRVDPGYIKQNFSKEYYVERLDGSIDIELTLYFKVQSYFYMGIIISGVTLVLLLIYVGHNLYKKNS